MYIQCYLRRDTHYEQQFFSVIRGQCKHYLIHRLNGQHTHVLSYIVTDLINFVNLILRI